MPSLRTVLGSFAVVSVALVLASCGASGDPSSTAVTSEQAPTTADRDETVAKLVPARYASTGTLSAGVFNGRFAPMIVDGSTSGRITGADSDFINAIAQVMGLKARLEPTTFDSILPGVQEGKYDTGISAITDTRDREKTVDLVTYMKAGTSFFDRANAPSGVEKPADLCGKKLAVLANTTQAALGASQSRKCEKAGNSKVEVLESSAEDLSQVAGWLKSGRVEVAMTDSPPASYEVMRSNGALTLSGEPFDVAPYGVAIAKDSGLAGPVVAAVQKLMADGQYKAILDKWGLQASSIEDPEINGAVN